MATGDATDMLARVRSLLPPWFPDQGSAPILDAILSGVAGSFAFVYSLITFAQEQARVLTASDGWLDLIAWDFFGGRFVRRNGEADPPWRARILAELTRERVTRAAVIKAITDVTGVAPRVIEAWRPTDVGCWDHGAGQSACFWDVDTPDNPFRWTSVDLGPAFFIECVLPVPSPAGNNAVPAYDRWTMAFDDYGAFIDLSPGTGGAQAVYDMLEAVRAAGVTAWVKFVPAQTNPHWDQPGATWDQPGAVWS